MPTYHYRCSSCGHAFDAFQRFSEDPLTDCPACEGSVRRVIQPVGVVFKGSGWYVTDSRPPSKTDAKAEKSDKPAEAKTSESAESKPAPSGKTETKVPSPV